MSSTYTDPELYSYSPSINPLQDFTQDLITIHPLPQEKKKKVKNIKKQKLEKKLSKIVSTSYVKVRNERKGIRLIKIKVLDLTAPLELDGDSESSDGGLLSAQYVVMDSADNIMEETEELVSKISRKLCGNDY